MKKPNKLQVELIQCIHCQTWNYPNIDTEGKISYPEACRNKDCRKRTYAGMDKRLLPENIERTKLLYKFRQNKNMRRFPRKIKLSTMYRRTA